MRNYIFRRLFLIIPTLIGITLATFIILQMVPGGPVEQAVMKIKGLNGGPDSSAQANENITEEEIQYLRQYYGFNKPAWVRYINWLSKVVRFDFGESYQYQKPVTEVIKSRFPISLTFGIISFILSYLICIPLGIFKSLKHQTPFDNISSIIVFAAYAVPGFALGVVLIHFFAGGEFLSIFPISGAVSDYFEELSFFGKIADFSYHMVLPLICYVIGNFAVLTMLMKNSLIEELGKDYMRTALAKGLPYRKTVFKHALSNALIPVVTGIGKILLIFFAGSLLIETVFNINGIGLLGYESIVARDYPLVMGLLVIQAFLALLGNLLSDVLYVVIDPRINFEGS